MMTHSTLTIDPDVAQILTQALHRDEKPLKQVVNDALRCGPSAAEPMLHKPFKVVPFAMGWNAGLDPTGFNRLIAQLAMDDYLLLV